MSFLRNLLNKNQYIKELGRWSTTKNNQSIIKTIDFANHDHCGGELCKIPNKPKIDIASDKQKITKKDDYYKPFLL